MARSWIVRPAPLPRPRLRLFCLPHAGGGASTFRAWAAALPPDVELCAVQLPGREGRLMEPAFSALSPLLAALDQALQPHLDVPFAFFGHSMGAMLSFELARRFRRQGRPGPSRLFASAFRAPDLPDRHAPIYALPDAQFVAHLRRLGGMPEALLTQAELMELLLPTLRADMEICDTYACAPEPPLAIPITAFGGTEDAEVTEDELAGWRRHTTGPFRLRMFPGNHFFLQGAAAPLLQEIGAELAGRPLGAPLP